MIMIKDGAWGALREPGDRQLAHYFSEYDKVATEPSGFCTVGSKALQAQGYE